MRDLEADLKLCEAATEGPWEWDYHFKQLVSRSADMNITGGIDPQTGFDDCGVFIGIDDRDFIAAARTGWPETIRELMEARSRINELESEIQRKDAILLSLTERVAAQSELLGKRSEKSS